MHVCSFKVIAPPPKMSTLARIEKYFETPHFAVFPTVNDTLYHHHHPVIMIVL